jgi:hypothetical protein
MEAKTNANQEKAEASMSASMKSNQDLLARLEARIETIREKDREDLKGMMEEMKANADRNQEEMLARMRENIKSSQAEMRSTVCSMRSELEQTIQHGMNSVIQHIRSGLDETTACNEATETEPDPGTKQSIEEHQEIPKGKAAVMQVGEPRKWRRVRNLAAERSQKMKERTQEQSESRRKSAAACRKVSRRAKVAWRKRELIRRIGTQENCGQRKEFSPAGIRMTHRVKVTWRKEQELQRIIRDNSAPGNPTGRTSRMRRWIGPECKTGIKVPRTRRHLRLQIERTTEFKRRSLGLEFLKRANGTSSGLLKIKDWTL